MRQTRNMMLLTGLILIVSLMLSCSKTGLGLFQENEASPGYKLFNILDNYPSLKDGAESMDQYTFNTKIADAVNANIDDFIVMSDKLTDLISGNGAWDANPLYDTLQTLRVILARIKYQDSNDYESGFTGYSGNFTSLLDTISRKDLNLSADLVAIMRAFMNYYKNVYTPAELETKMSDLIADLQDPLKKADIENIFEIVSKLMVQADYPMYQTASDGTLNTVSHSESGTSTNLGNAVAGNISMIQGLNEMFHRDQTAKNDLYGMIRELGPALSSTNGVDASSNMNDAGHVLKDLICNMEDYFTAGGAVYSADSRYNTNSATTYSSAEFHNIIRDMIPGLAAIMMRNDRSPSIVTTSGDKQYVLGYLAGALAKLGIDWDNADIEESLYDLIRYDLYGQDRRTNSSAWPVSFLETFLFLGMSGDNVGWNDGETTSEAGFNPNDNHGHGKSTGYVTLNDAFFSMRTNDTLDMTSIGLGEVGLYQLAFSNNGHIFRNNKTSFTHATASSYAFYYDQNMGAMGFLPGACVGDYGLPSGGANGSTLNEFVPYCGDGIQEKNLTAWVLGWSVRACWNGEGPYYYAPTSASTVSISYNGTTANYYVYKRPNGKVYAYVNKGTSPWTYIYPKGDSDPADTTADSYILYGSQYQRENRFRSTWYTDYYLIHWVDLFGYNRYFAPDGTYSTSSSTAAGRLQYAEKSLTDTQRACASQEEAIFRNYQWVCTEKKFVLVIPLYAELLTEMGGAFVILEANGFAGVTVSRKYRNVENNGNWAKDTGSGDSTIPGDYRLTIKLQSTGLGILSMSAVLNTLGNGSIVPPTLAHTAPALYRFGFPRSACVPITNYIQNQLGSQDFIASSSDTNWRQRNTLLPVIIALLGVLRENSDQSKHAIEYLLTTMIQPLYPMFYYNKSESGAVQQSWVPRIAGSDSNKYDFLFPDCEVSGFVSSTSDSTGWYGGDTVHYYYQPRPVNTMFSLLIDSSLSGTTPVTDRSSTPLLNRADGLLPLLTHYDSTTARSSSNQSPTHLVTDVLKLLTRMGDSSYDDPGTVDDADSSTWGTRRKLLYGLEQVMTTFKLTKGTGVAVNESNFKNIVYPKWMFTDYGMRPEDNNLEDTLDLMIGDNTYANWGLSVFPDERNSSDSNYPSNANAKYRKSWLTFYDNTAMLKEFMAGTGNYSIVRNIINIIDKGIGGVSESDMTTARASALVHTLGMLMSTYDTTGNKWLVDGDTTDFSAILDLLTKELPVILTQFQGTYSGTVSISADMMASGGFIEYIMNNATTPYSWSNIVDDGYAFLADPVLARDSVFWHDIVDLVNDMAQTMKASENTGMGEFFEKNGFQYNGEVGRDELGNFNLYKGLGMTLSK